MQKIIHSSDYKPISPLFTEIESFYAYTSEKTLQVSRSLVQPVFDNSFRTLQSLFNQFGENEYNFSFKDKVYKSLKLREYDEKNIILCFSGGRDSAATAFVLKECGYNVYLYHVKNINRAYPDEWKRAQDIADYLELPIYFDKVQFQGKIDFVEHPMKNMIIANGAIEYGIKNNIGVRIATGNFLSSGDVSKENFYICGDDTPTVWDSYIEIINRIIPDFTIDRILEDSNDTLDILAYDLKLLELCQSCMGAHRFRQWNHDNNEKKYGIKLLPNRCGSCWKCAIEYIYLADHDKINYNKEYYKHCLDVLRKMNKKENGVTFTTWENLWYDFFAYEIAQSKYLGG